MTTSITYRDRFGHDWQTRVSRSAKDGWSCVFTHGNVRLISEDPIDSHPSELSEAEVKNLFCDAERVIQGGEERWFVGYRQRAFGRQRRAQGSLFTRFRSEGGEVRYSRDMLDFRHLPEATLRDHLDTLRRGGARAKSA